MDKVHKRTIDWYLVGLILYQIIVGMPPYNSFRKEKLLENIKKEVLKFPLYMSEQAKELVKSLLIRDPSKRLGAKADAEEIKKHAFFKNINWDDIYNRVQDGPYIEQDCNKQWVKEIIDMKFNDQSQTSQRLLDWSFIQ